MTWTKIGDEWPDAARDLSDSAHRTHVDALCWSNRRGLDLVIPRRDLKRFAETADPESAVMELVGTGWWQDLGDGGWYIGCRFSDWQIDSAVIEARRQANADRQRRHRLHKVGDHRLCTDKCSVTRYETSDVTRDETRDPGRDGSGRDGNENNGLDRSTQTKLSDATYTCQQCQRVVHSSLIAGRCRDCQFTPSKNGAAA